MHVRQGVQGVVKILRIQTMLGAVIQDAVKGNAAAFSAPFLGFPASCVLDQNLKHGPSHRVHQTGTVCVRTDLALHGEAKPGFVEEGRWVEGYAPHARQPSLALPVRVILRTAVRSAGSMRRYWRPWLSSEEVVDSLRPDHPTPRKIFKAFAVALRLYL